MIYKKTAAFQEVPALSPLPAFQIQVIFSISWAIIHSNKRCVLQLTGWTFVRDLNFPRCPQHVTKGEKTETDSSVALLEIPILCV